MQKERYGYWVGGVNARRDLNVQEHLIWEIVKRAKSEGFKKLDLGEPTQRTSLFKAKFDPVLEPYCTVERMDTLYNSVNFARKKLSRAKKHVSNALLGAHL
jgi:lipid II:glycine glycyltransferase (peptidoglycan interpeptide bridge formation enzyme)